MTSTPVSSTVAVSRGAAALAILRMVENQMSAFNNLASSTEIESDEVDTILRIIENQTTTINTIPPPIDKDVAVAVLRILETQTTSVKELLPHVRSDTALAILRIFENQKKVLSKIPSSIGDVTVAILRILENQTEAADQFVPVLFGETSTRTLKRRPSLDQQDPEAFRTKKRARGDASNSSLNKDRPHPPSPKRRVPPTPNDLSVDKLATCQPPTSVSEHQKQPVSISNTNDTRYDANGKPVNEHGQRICEKCHTTGTIHHKKPGVVTEKWVAGLDGRPGMLCEKCRQQEVKGAMRHSPTGSPSPEPGPTDSLRESATTTPALTSNNNSNNIRYNADGKPINEHGQRICAICHSAGRLHQTKPGVVTERWGRGVDGKSGMLCGSCRRQVTSQANTQLSTEAGTSTKTSPRSTPTLTQTPAKSTTLAPSPSHSSSSSEDTDSSNNNGIRYNANGKPINEHGQRICEKCHTTGRIHHEKPGVVTERWARGEDGRLGVLCEKCSQEVPSKVNTRSSTRKSSPLPTPKPSKVAPKTAGNKNKDSVRYYAGGKLVNKQGEQICEKCYGKGRVDPRTGESMERWATGEDGRPGTVCGQCRKLARNAHT